MEDELAKAKSDQQHTNEKDKELMVNIEKLEKNLIKEINDEQRRLSSLIPGLIPKLVNYSK